MNKKTCLQIAVLPLFAALALGSGSPKGGAADDKSSTTTTTSAAIGTPVLVGDAEWTILEIVNRGSTMKGNDSFDKDATTPGTFVQVKFKVANRGKKEGTMGELPKLVDPTNREFGSYETASLYRPKDSNGVFLDKIQPSLSKEFVEIYEVAPGVTSLSLKAHDFGIFGKEKALSLGVLPPAQVVAPSKAAPVAAAPQGAAAAGAKPKPATPAAPAAVPAPAAPAKSKAAPKPKTNSF